MKILLLESSHKRREQLSEELMSKNVQVVSCVTTNDFLDTLSESPFDKIVMNADFWEKGKSIYCYFGIGKKLQNTPLLVYGAEEKITAVCDRTRHDEDRFLTGTADVETIIEAVLQN